MQRDASKRDVLVAKTRSPFDMPLVSAPPVASNTHALTDTFPESVAATAAPPDITSLLTASKMLQLVKFV